MKYILTAIESKKDLSQIKAIVVDYNKDDNSLPKVIEQFKADFTEGDSRSIERAYFSFEDFTFKHQRSTIASWGDFAIKKIKEMSATADADFKMAFDDKEFVDLMESFQSHMKLKRPVTFKKAYENIAGRHLIGNQKDDFHLLINMSVFLGNALGDKFTKRHDGQINKKTSFKNKTRKTKKEPTITIKRKV